MPRAHGPLTDFFAEYGRALDDRTAALFIGAGISHAAGFKLWPDLLRDLAGELGLEVDRESDLPALAQYHVNVATVRTRLDQMVIDEFGREVPLTEDLRLIARLPVETVWTTNYDQLIEQALRETRRRCDVKISTANLATTARGRDVTVFKMHGDITRPHEAVLTKDDYEMYGVTRQGFVDALRGDLIQKTFLFLGFSFSDPNIDYILSRIRVLQGQHPRRHFCVMKRPAPAVGGGADKADHEYQMRKLELRLADLKRYGIQPIMIDDYSEITAILSELNRGAHRNTILVSGSAHDYSPMGQQRLEELAYAIGQETIRRGYRLISGVGLGTGSPALSGAISEVYSTEAVTVSDRITMRPFPRAVPEHKRSQLYGRYREDMLSRSGFVVLISGNRLNPDTGQVETARGVLEEFSIAKALGRCAIPVGASGWAAREVWQEIIASMSSFYPSIQVEDHFAVLGDVKKSNQEMVEAIFSVVEEVARI